MAKIKKTFFIAISTILIVGFVYFTDHNFNFAPASLAGAGHNLSGYAWSENIGWISFNNTTGGGATSYGVNIDPVTGILSGYAWSENIGWIKFDPTGPYPSTPNYPAKLDITTNQVTGWARACSGTKDNCVNASRTDGWDGWIKMAGATLDGHTYGVTRSSGSNCGLTGYAWGSDVVGWIKFQGTATNGSVYGVSSTFCEPIRELCEESVTEWGSCQCPKEKKERTHIKPRPEDPYQCYGYIEEQDCNRQEKNSCRDFNFREVAP